MEASVATRVRPDDLARWQWPLLAATTALGVVIFLHGQISSGFTRLFGDHYDGFIEVAILQHWNNVLHGAQAWNVTGYFYPYPDTLGYNDGYFVYGLVYTAIRAFGADALLAADLMHATVKAFGCVGMYLLLRTVCRYRVSTSLIGALLFTISTNSIAQAIHGQLFAIAFAPLGALLLCRFAQALLHGTTRDVATWSAAFSVYYAAWLLTAYYMAWFFGFFTIVVVIVAVIAMGPSGRRDILQALRRRVVGLLAGAAVFAIAVTPFLVTYLPKARETGMHHWIDVLYYSLSPLYLINVGPNNLVWAGVFEWLHQALARKSEVGHEFVVGFPFVFLGIAIAGIVATLRAKRDLYWWVAVAVVVTWVLALNYGPPKAFSPWEIIFKCFPGGRGMRVIARYQLFLTFPLVIFAMRWFDTLKRQWVVAALGLWLVVEQWNSAPPTFIDRPAELASLAGVPQLPAQCESFYIVSARATPYPTGHDDLIYAHNTDAMLIAALQAKPTLMGFSTFNPPGWDFVNPSASDFRERARKYIRDHGLTNVCYLDRLQSPDWQLETP